MACEEITLPCTSKVSFAAPERSCRALAPSAIHRADGDDASSGIASSGNSGAVCKMIGRNYGMGVVVWFYELFVVARAVVWAAWRSQSEIIFRIFTK